MDDDSDELWQKLDTILSTRDEHNEIDDALRAFLSFSSEHKDDLAECCQKLLNSALFNDHQAYIRRQMLYCLLQDDDQDTIHIAAAVCLYDGRRDETFLETMQAEGAFTRLIEMISSPEDEELHRLLITLLFELARIQTLDRESLASVSDDFILFLFRLIEDLSNDADDPYHYPVIRVLLVLNEQYMCYESLTNRILKLLSTHGPLYRTFGENLILLLNRESALGAQLLILKLLYLLFTTPSTFEYFYTNDLHVLVDVIIRNLLDLGSAETDGHKALRHTYLRVLCPLLKNTQLARNHYKRDELRRLMNLLINQSSVHFAPVDETVSRLVIRCQQIEWLSEGGDHKLGSLDAACESSLSIADISAKQKPMLPAPRRKKKVVELPTMSANVSNALPRSPFAD